MIRGTRPEYIDDFDDNERPMDDEERLVLSRLRGVPESVPPSPSKSKGQQHAYGGGAYSSSTTSTDSASNRLFKRLTNPLINFWYTDPALPPLYGPLRFVFYISMLIILLWQPEGSGSKCFRTKSCKRAIRRFAHYETFGFDMKFEAGFFGHALFYLNLDPKKVFNCLWLSYGVKWGMAACAIGLGGIFPRCIVAISWWTMFGIKMASFGPSVGHEQYLAGVALIAFCFAENNLLDCWSVDSLLVKAWAKIRDTPPTSISAASSAGWDGISPSPGRAARKIVLFQASCVMFFAGVHKFASYGFTWLDGGTILHSLHPGNDARIDALRAFVVDHSWFFVAPMATVSVIGELLSMAAVLSPNWRHIVVGSWIMFHTGIMILMHPNFAMNMASYIVLIDWRGLLGGTRLVECLPFLSDSHTCSIQEKNACVDNMNASSHPRSRRVGALMYTAVATVMFTTALLRIDYWPFSSYALYNWHPSDPGFHGAKFTAAEAIASANRCLSQPPLGPTCGNKSGSNHHDSFVSMRKYSIKKVFVTGVSSDDKDGPIKEERGCGPNDLRVYSNWQPHSCLPRPTDGSKLSPDDIRMVLRVPTVRGKRRKAEKKPKELPKKIWNEYTTQGLSWRVEDAITASLDEGPKCFEGDSEDAWAVNPSADSIASDLARRIRSGLTLLQYLPDYPKEKVLGVAFFWEFIDERSEDGVREGGESTRWCKIGESVMGDLDLLSEDGDNFVRFRNHVANHERLWTEVYRGIVLVSAMAVALGVYIRWNNSDESSLPINRR